MFDTKWVIVGICALSAGIAAPVQAQDIATTYDEEWISLTGTVDTVGVTSFVLDYGDNDITVELDRFDWDIAKSGLAGQQVTVTGRMDRNLYDQRSIEAGLVYVPAQAEYIYANPADEEGDPTEALSFAPGLFAGAREGDWLSFSGRVTAIEGDEIMVDTGVATLRVDTSILPGALASPSVDIGDRVLVTGIMDAPDLFDKREVEANSVTKLTDASY